jgi:hypothetical protein
VISKTLTRCPILTVPHPMIWDIRSVAVVLALVTISMLSWPARAAETAGELATLCIGVANAPVARDGRLHFDPTFENGRCWGAFAAVQELSRMKRTTEEPPLLGICAPETTTRLDLIKAFSDYVRAHPESRTEQFSVIVIASLRTRFPC